MKAARQDVEFADPHKQEDRLNPTESPTASNDDGRIPRVANWRSNPHLIKREPGGPGLDPGRRLAAALSGGGNRAALFGLGVLIALHDSKRLPCAITSVSGGSITNLMLANLYYSKPDEQGPDLWEFATNAVFEAVCKGSLTRSWIVSLASYAIGAPLLIAALLYLDIVPVWAAGLLIAAWATSFLLRGLLIEAIMARRYIGSGWRGRRLGDIRGGPQHVFSCTDLVVGQPVHFSSPDKIYRRNSDVLGGRNIHIKPNNGDLAAYTTTTWHDIWAKESDTMQAGILRATAGFSGIPPRLIHWSMRQRLYPPAPGSADSPKTGFLSDGGFWNNLATEPFEDHTVGLPNGPVIVVVSDASARVRPISPFPFRIPGWAEIRTLVRQAKIQNTNTVGPRRRVFQDRVMEELRAARSTRLLVERLYLVVSCIETPGELVERFERDVTQTDDVFSKLKTVSGDKELIERFNRWCVKDTSDGLDLVAHYPTSLGKVQRDVATAIVARGYCNAALTLHICGVTSTVTAPMGWLGAELARKNSPADSARAGLP